MAPLISRVIPSKNPCPFPIDPGPTGPPQKMYLRPERFAELPAYTLPALAAFLIRTYRPTPASGRSAPRLWADWPIRWARPIACSSAVGFHHGSVVTRSIRAGTSAIVARAVAMSKLVCRPIQSTRRQRRTASRKHGDPEFLEHLQPGQDHDVHRL